ncbi:hypothetical protein B0H13DRAFT_527800 [Mycena leptocephala]|nr:hypothetical protein B0H13DRAFT_527800 [Mycena leptocephala]
MKSHRTNFALDDDAAEAQRQTSSMPKIETTDGGNIIESSPQMTREKPGDSSPLIPTDGPFSHYCGDNAPVWKLYMDHARISYDNLVNILNSDLDPLLIFAGLFSAILSAFLIEIRKGLCTRGSSSDNEHPPHSSHQEPAQRHRPADSFFQSIRAQCILAMGQWTLVLKPNVQSNQCTWRESGKRLGYAILFCGFWVKLGWRFSSLPSASGPQAMASEPHGSVSPYSDPHRPVSLLHRPRHLGHTGRPYHRCRDPRVDGGHGALVCRQYHPPHLLPRLSFPHAALRDHSGSIDWHVGTGGVLCIPQPARHPEGTSADIALDRVYEC